LAVPDTNDYAQMLPVLEEVYTQVKKVRRELLPDDRIVQDLEVDSLATLEILLALEERFGVELVGDPRVVGVSTVADLIRLLEETRNQAAR
jgi:acyl carrier protein